MMKNNNTFDFGGGFKISVENDTPVPDTTKDAGPDTIKLHEDAQKPATDKDAEYDAAAHADTPEAIERANESTIFGIILRHRSMESFAKTKISFPNAEAFFKSNECKQGVAVAKQWAGKHNMSLASSGEIPENLKKSGISTKSISGATLTYSVHTGRVVVDIIFKNAKGKAVAKQFAVIKIDSKKAAGSESTSPAKSPKQVLTKEGDDPVDNAFTETTDTPPAAEPTAEPAAEPPVDSPISDISAEEIEKEAEGTESFLAAIMNIRRSREEANAVASNIDSSEIDEVVGDSEGDAVEEVADTVPEPVEDSEELKAIESFLASF
jgi:hypothetical protein